MRLILFSILAAALLWWGYEKAVDNCYASSFYLHKWPVIQQKPLSAAVRNKLDEILKQPFTYLGKGRQFFVFESRDHKWVLKFIKCQRLNPTPLLDTFRSDRLQEKKKRIERIFTSLQLAQEKLSDLTGVVYVHLHPNTNLNRNVTLINRLGISFEQNLDEVPCCIQKKAELIFPVLESIHKEEELQTRLSQLTTLLTELASRNVIDIDDGAILRDNIAFLPDRAVYVDVGTFVPDPNAEARLQTDLKRLDPIYSWINAKECTASR